MNAALDVIHEALQQYTRNAPSCLMTWMQPQLLNASNGADVLQAGTKKRCLDQDTVQLNDIHSAKEDFKKTAETTSLIETAGYHNADAEASSTKQGKKLAEIEREASETNDAALRLLEGSHLATPPIGATCAQPDMKSFNALLEGEKINDGILPAVLDLDDLGPSVVIHPCTVDSDWEPSAPPSVRRLEDARKAPLLFIPYHHKMAEGKEIKQ